MKIIGVLVDILFEMDSGVYRKHVVFENGKLLIYGAVLITIYEMLVTALLFYNLFWGD